MEENNEPQNTPQEPQNPPQDTIYNFASDAPSNIVEATIALTETNSAERKSKLLAQAVKLEHEQNRNVTIKKIAKLAVSGIDNLDAVLGTIERIGLLAIAELFRRGDWFSALLVCFLVIVAWIWKIRRPQGPLIAFFRLEPTKIRAKILDLTKTAYWG